MVGTSGGPFTVQLDGVLSKTLNASWDKPCPQMVLYHASGLDPGQHTMRVINSPFLGQTLGVDYAVVWMSS